MDILHACIGFSTARSPALTCCVGRHDRHLVAVGQLELAGFARKTRQRLTVGNVSFRQDSILENIEGLPQFCVILNAGQHWITEGNGT